MLPSAWFVTTAFLSSILIIECHEYVFPAVFVCEYGLSQTGNDDAELVHTDGHLTTLTRQSKRYTVAENPDVTDPCGFRVNIKVRKQSGDVGLSNLELEFGVRDPDQANDDFRISVRMGAIGADINLKDRDNAVSENVT